MTYSEILAANFESTGMNETQSTGEGSCIEPDTCRILEDPKVENPNLKNLEVENFTSNALDIIGNLYPCQPIDADTLAEGPRDPRFLLLIKI